MRSFLLILATLIVLGAGAAIYVYLQPPAARMLGHTITASNKQRPQLERTLRGVGDGENPWVKSIDAKTGEIKSQMRARVWLPQRDNSVNVTDPQAEFFSTDGKQRIRIDGTDGNIIMPPSPDNNKTAKLGQSGPTGMPSRGKLHNVIISIFEPIDATEPQLVARMNNAAFDTDLFHIATESFKDEKGNTIEADRVPVTLRGRDYDFDGEGLIINWNERDRKLQLLEVAHGKSLVIKNPSALGHSELMPSTQPTSEATPSAIPDSTPGAKPQQSAAVLRGLPTAGPPLPDVLASTDPHAHNLILTAAKPKKPPPKPSVAAKRRKAATAPATAPTTNPRNYRDLSPVLYCATFERDVRVFQEDSPHPDEPVATGDQMKIYFLQVPEKSATTQTSTPAGASTGKAPAKPATQASTQPSTRGTRSTTRRADATSRPGDQPPTTQQSPVTIKWKGKLRVIPIDSQPDVAMVPGKAIVHLTGMPTKLDQRGMKAECGEAVFNSASNSARLYPISTTQPIVMHTEEGWIVHTEKQVQYDEDPTGPRLATLIGHSTAKIPVDSDQPGTPSFMNSSWTDTCKLHLLNVEGRAVMQQVDLAGDVVVDHPKLSLTSKDLSLKFDPTASPTTRRSTSQPTTAAVTQPAASPSSLAVSQPTTVATTLASSRPTTRATTSPSNAVTATLREIIATGDADCIIKDPEDAREIKSKTLDVHVAESADHQMYAKVVDADGDVHATEKGSSMTAGHLTAHLAPSTRPTIQATTQAILQDPPLAASRTSNLPTTFPSTRPTTRHATTQDFGGNVRLESMVATDNVVLKTDDGTTAEAAELHANTVDDQLSYELIGKPNAIITSTKGNNGKTVISGPVIQYDPQQNIARVIGGGSGQGSNPNNPTQLMNLTWTGDAIVDGNTNLIDVDQNVVVISHDADGTVDTATSRHLQAIMTTRPTTEPTTQPTTLAVSQPTTQPTTLASSRPTKTKNPDDTTSFMKDKEITAGILTGHVVIVSELKNPDDTPARKMNLYAEKVIYDTVVGRLDIPVTGELLYQDHREPTTQQIKAARARAATKPADDQNSPNMGSGKGNTAFRWDDSLVYERAQKTMTMTGNVHVVHQPDSEGSAPFTLISDILTATFEPKPTTQPTTQSTTQSTQPSADETTQPTSLASSRPSTRPTSKPTTRPQEDLGQLKLITATGHVQATSTLMNFDAPQMTFDPVNQILTATGDPRHPVSFFHAGSGARTLVTKLYWNTVTDEIRLEKVIGTLQRK